MEKRKKVHLRVPEGDKGCDNRECHHVEERPSDYPDAPSMQRECKTVSGTAIVRDITEFTNVPTKFERRRRRGSAGPAER